jgi:lysyl oxidase-like protein 2/3/4
LILILIFWFLGENAILQVVINPDFKVAEMSFDNNAVVCTLYYGQQYATLFNCSLQRP